MPEEFDFIEMPPSFEDFAPKRNVRIIFNKEKDPRDWGGERFFTRGN